MDLSNPNLIDMFDKLAKSDYIDVYKYVSSQLRYS